MVQFHTVCLTADVLLLRFWGDIQAEGKLSPRHHRRRTSQWSVACHNNLSTVYMFLSDQHVVSFLWTRMFPISCFNWNCNNPQCTLNQMYQCKVQFLKTSSYKNVEITVLKVKMTIVSFLLFVLTVQIQNQAIVTNDWMVGPKLEHVFLCSWAQTDALVTKFKMLGRETTQIWRNWNRAFMKKGWIGESCRS